MVTDQNRGLKPANRPYQPFGTALDVFRSKDEEILVSGSAGTGKSRAWLEKLHACAEKYPGMRGMIVRKTRTSLSETGLMTFETKVVPEGHHILTPVQRNNRQHYHYRNGSEIVVGGLDKPGSIMSSEYDFIYVQEAIELNIEDWESLTTRLRNGMMPYQQLGADTNPDTPYHWLKRRCDSGATRMVQASHEDNPVLFDHSEGTWTEAGRRYLAVLDKLTGPRKARLAKGQWVSAEGQIYEDWDITKHLVDSDKIGSNWPRIWSVDFGYTNPFVWQNWAIDPDSRMYLTQEIYMTGRLVEDHAKQILKVATGPKPSAIVCDHDAEGRATLEKHLGNVSTIPATKAINEGIQLVQSRMKEAGDRKPRFFVVRDSLVELDPTLQDGAHPTCTADEVPGYIWDPTKKKGDTPVDKDNHGCDAMRYACAHLDWNSKNEATSSSAMQIGKPKPIPEPFDPEYDEDLLRLQRPQLETQKKGQRVRW